MTDFPVQFDKCPVCGSERRLVEEEVTKEIAEGKLSPGTMIPALMSQSVMYNPIEGSRILARRLVPCLVGIYDVCADCGTLYLHVMVKQAVGIEPQAQQKQNFPGSSGNGGKLPWQN